MAVPKRKTSQSRKGMRHGGQVKETIGAYAESPDTGSLVRRHHASVEKDGSVWYRGHQVKAAKVKAEPVDETPVAE